MARFLAAFFGAALVVALAAGCDSEDSSKYSVDVYWQIAGADVCTANSGIGGELTFETVRISVYEAEDDPTTIQAVEVPCADNEYTIEGLSRGEYWVRVDALATVEGDEEELPYFQAEQAIVAPSEATDPRGYKFALEVGKATVEVIWGFDTPGMCPQHDVANVQISIDPLGSMIPCDDGSYIIEDVPWQEQTITVTGLDADDNEVTEGSYNDGDPFEIKPKEYLGDDAIYVEMSDL